MFLNIISGQHFQAFGKIFRGSQTLYHSSLSLRTKHSLSLSLSLSLSHILVCNAYHNNASLSHCGCLVWSCNCHFVFVCIIIMIHNFQRCYSLLSELNTLAEWHTVIHFPPNSFCASMSYLFVCMCKLVCVYACSWLCLMGLWPKYNKPSKSEVFLTLSVSLRLSAGHFPSFFLFFFFWGGGGTIQTRGH